MHSCLAQPFFEWLCMEGAFGKKGFSNLLVPTYIAEPFFERPLQGGVFDNNVFSESLACLLSSQIHFSARASHGRVFEKSLAFLFHVSLPRRAFFEMAFHGGGI